MTEQHDSFIHYLESLRDNHDRGALATLRRGLGETPGTAVEMFPYVMPHIPYNTLPWESKVYFLVAALFAYHPDPGGTGNMGAHFAQARDPNGENIALERRFTVLLASHPDDLPFHLRQAISFLKSVPVPVNWGQLFTDVMAWSHHDRYVQRQWAVSFWQRHPKSEQESQI